MGNLSKELEKYGLTADGGKGAVTPNGDTGKVVPAKTTPAPAEDPKGAEGDADLEGAEVDRWWEKTKAGDAFARIKAEKKAADARIAELEALVKDSESWKTERETGQNRLTELEKALEDKEKALAGYNIRETRMWQEKVGQPFSELEAAAKEIGGDDLWNALNLEDPKARKAKIAELSEDMLNVDQVEVVRITRDMDKLLKLDADLQKDARANLAKIQEDEKLEATRRTAAERKKYEGAVDTAAEQLLDKLPMFLDENTGAFGKEFQDVVAKAKGSNIAASAPLVQAYFAITGGVFPALLGKYKTVISEKAALEARVAELTGSRPGAGSGGGQAPSGGRREGLSFLEAIQQGAAEAGMQ